MSDITLSKAVRANLQSLRNTASMMAQTQNTLATGKKVNSALDNPSNFFTASSLNARAGDMNALMDGMANGIQTLEAADNGLKAITKTLESMQSTLRQARQDKSFETASYSIGLTESDNTEQLTFSGGAVGDAVNVSLSTGTVETPAAGGSATISGEGFEAIAFSDDGAGTDDTLTFSLDIDGSGTPTDIEITTTEVNSALGKTSIDSIEELAEVIAADADFAALDATAEAVDGNLVITSSATTGEDSTIEITTGFAANDDSGEGTVSFGSWDPSTPTEAAGTDDVYGVRSVDQLVSTINGNADLKGKIRASNDNGNLRIENLSTQELSVDGASADGSIDGTSSGVSSIDGNSVRADLATQYNELRDQLDKLADDASFNGVNLLRGDNLQITFNETGTSELNIQTKGGETINSANLKIQTELSADQLDSDSAIDGFLSEVKSAVNTVRSQSSAFGSSLSIVQNRQDFTSNMMNTLETGAANLTLADSNEEAANLLALQTRQQLSSTALSMASQQDQSVLRLF